VKLYRVVNGKKLFEDSIERTVNVAGDPSTKITIEVKCPPRAGLGGSFECLLEVENNNSETIGVQLNNITFRGEVNYVGEDTNQTRSEQLKGIFYLSGFKEVPPHSSRSIPIDLGKVDDEFASHFGLSNNHRLLSAIFQGY
ncbi:hypothetical protein, partial [Thermococcus sp. GR7]